MQLNALNCVCVRARVTRQCRSAGGDEHSHGDPDWRRSVTQHAHPDSERDERQAAFKHHVHGQAEAAQRPQGERGLQRGERAHSGEHPGQARARRRDVHGTDPAQDLQRDHCSEAGQKLDKGQIREVVRGDEELQQDVERTGENAVRDRHRDAQQSPFTNFHRALLWFGFFSDSFLPQNMWAIGENAEL